MQRSLGILALCVGCGAAQSLPPAQPAALAVDQSTVDFATTLPGSASAETLLHVTNSGGEPTAPIATALSGDAAFAVTSDTCAGQSLAPAATCEIHLVFRPSQQGPLAAELRISAGPLAATVALGGRAEGSARLSLSNASHSFAGIELGQSATSSITVTNTGNIASGALAADPGGDVASFSVGGDCIGRALGPSQSCILLVTFTPQNLGVKMLTLGVSAPGSSAVPATFDGYGTRRVTLTVSIAGDGEVMVSGTRCAAPGCSLPFVIGGAAVRAVLTANAGSKFVFRQWSGDCGALVPTCDVTMDHDRSVLATFEPGVTLSVEVSVLAGGEGSVRVVPGSTCQAPCTVKTLVRRGQPVWLGAAAGPQSQFRWTGACRGTADACQLTVDADAQVGLVFNGANYVFVTSQSYPTNLGVPGYDAACNERASAAGLPGRYVAWLSTSSGSAFSRVGPARGFIRVDGRPFADTLAPGAAVYFPAALDEFGQLRNPYTRLAMTGTGLYGEREGNCSDWTATDNSPLALGDPLTGAGAWTGWAGGGCSWRWLVYCMGTGIDRPLQRDRVPGRVAFVSVATLAPGGGLAAADALCRTEAASAGLSGSFKALLPADGASAASRFDLKGAPWVRPDGVPIVDKAADLATGTLIAPIDQHASGPYDLEFYFVWAGAPGPGAVGTAASTCASWTSMAPDLYTSSATDTTIESNWYGSGYVPCNAWGRVICLQE